MGCLAAAGWVIVKGVALTSLLVAFSLALLLGYFAVMEAWKRRPWHD